MRMVSIASGSNGNCTYLGSDRTHLLIDAGISGKKVEEGLRTAGLCPADLSGICITHEHIDHVKGLGVLARRYGLPIYTTAGTRDEILKMTSLGEIPQELFRVIEADNGFCIGDLEMFSMAISHDAADPVAYLARSGAKSMGVVTDLGTYNERQVERLQGLDMLILEANHDLRMLEIGSYPYYLKQRIAGDEGHLSNITAGQLLCRLLHDDFKTVILGHLSDENNYPELAYETVRTEITMSDVKYNGDDFPIHVARRNTCSGIFEV